MASRSAAPGDEGDFVAPCGEPGAEVAPDTTRPHDGYTHDVFLPVRDMGVNRTGAGSTLSGWFATRGLETGCTQEEHRW